MMNTLLRLHEQLKWDNLKFQTEEVAKAMEIIAPLFVKQTIKLSKTRKAQSVSGRSKK